MLESRVLPLGVLSDYGKVDVLMSSGETRKGFADHDGRVDVECLTHGDVPRIVSGLVDGGVQDT